MNPGGARRHCTKERTTMKQSNHDHGQLILKLCGCGQLHCTYGPFTIHLNREEFLVFADQIIQAARYLKQSPESLEPMLHAGQPSTSCH